MARRIPSNAARRARAPREPRAVVLTYRRALRSLVRRLERAALAELDLERFSTARTDAAPEFIRQQLGNLELRLAQILTPEMLDDLLGPIGRRIARRNLAETRRVIPIPLFLADAGVAPLVSVFRDQNVRLITSLGNDVLREVTLILERTGSEALRVEELRAEIQGRFGVARSRADLIARDQVLKLNGQITRQRQTTAGVTQYIWTTSKDERVREIHAELDGTTQDWNNPPVVSEDGRTEHPAGDFQCRCVAFPILPELGPELSVAR